MTGFWSQMGMFGQRLVTLLVTIVTNPDSDGRILSDLDGFAHKVDLESRKPLPLGEADARSAAGEGLSCDKY